MLHNPKWDEGLLDLNKPSLRALSYILRHKELWPEGFKWNFDKCHSCAMGMAKTLWEFKSYYPEQVAVGLDLPLMTTRRLFCFEAPKMPRDRFGNANPSKVTPKMVADWIDTYLAEHA